MSDIKGLVFQSRLDYLENMAENNAYQQMMKKLPDPVRQAVGEQVFPSNLYPFHLLQNMDNALGASVSQPLENIFREIGARHAEGIIDRYFYNYEEARNPQKFLEQFGRLYSYLWDFGTYSYQKTGDRNAQVTFGYDEDIHKSYCWFMQEFLKKGVGICGGNAVKLNEKECEAEDGESCLYELQWS